MTLLKTLPDVPATNVVAVDSKFRCSSKPVPKYLYLSITFILCTPNLNTSVHLIALLFLK